MYICTHFTVASTQHRGMRFLAVASNALLFRHLLTSLLRFMLYLYFYFLLLGSVRLRDAAVTGRPSGLLV